MQPIRSFHARWRSMGLCLILACAGPAAGADGPHSAFGASVPSLTGAVPDPSAADGETTGAQPASGEEKAPAPSLKVSGFVDLYYEYNFNRPPAYKKGPGGAKIKNDIENKLRNFDFKHNEIALNLAEVTIERAPKPFGFRVDLAYGKATEWVHLSEPGDRSTWEHLLQAYFTTPLRLGGRRATLDAGKFVTHHGAEVIPSQDNWNYTRSFLFAWAIPYYHAGLRLRVPLTESSGLGVFVYNGWNDVEDNNNALSYGLQYNRRLSRKLSWVQNWTGGPELMDDNGHWRHLFDTVLTYTASPKSAAMLNFDYAHESREGGDVSWVGLAGYLRHAVSGRRAVALRAEWFDDGDGATTGTPQTLWEITLTYEWKHGSSLLTRVEARYDRSNEEVFDQGGGTSKQQPTLLIGAVYSF